MNAVNFQFFNQFSSMNSIARQASCQKVAIHSIKNVSIFKRKTRELVFQKNLEDISIHQDKKFQIELAEIWREIK